MIKYITLLLLLTIAGCSTSPSVSFKKETPPNADEALIYVYRSSVFQGSESRGSALIRLNGKVIGKLSNGSYIPVKVPAGKHKLTARSRSFGNDSSVVIAEKSLEIEAGKTLFLKYSESIQDVQFTGSAAYATTDADFYIMTPSMAANEISNAKLSSL